MTTHPKTGLLLSLEEVFDQATEDASIFLWATQSWPAPPSGYSRGYVLTLALTHRARSRAALEVVRGSIPPAMEEYASTLEKIIGRAESLLAGIAEEYPEEIQSVVDGELLDSVGSMSQALEKIQRLEEDARLFHKLDLASLELREAAHEFLLRYACLAHVQKELDDSVFGFLDCPALDQAMSGLGKAFAESFNTFNVIQDLWPAFSGREYGQDLWWLAKVPEAMDLELETVSEEVMDALAQTMAREALELDDHMARQAISLGLGEVDPTQRKQILEDLAVNWEAMDICQAARDAAVEAKETTAAPELLPSLAKAIRKPSPIAHWMGAVARNLSNVFSPKLVAAAAMACLALFIIVGMPVDPAPDHRVAEVAPSTATPPQTKLPEGILGVTARKDDRYINRVSALGAMGPDVFEMKPDWALESGDSLRVKASVDQDAYVYVLHIGPKNNASKLFSGQVKGGEVFSLPGDDEWFILDREVGMENILLISGTEPVDRFEEKMSALAGLEDALNAFEDQDVKVFSFKHL